MFGSWAIVAVFAALYFLTGAAIDSTVYMAIWAILFVAASIVISHWLDTKGSERFAEL